MIYDVVVIGASTAGLYAAELLALKGQKVALFESKKQISPDARTYIITPGLKRIVPDFDQGLERHKTGSIVIQSGDEIGSIQLSAPDLVVERSQLIENFIARGKKAGVEIFFDSKFLGFGLGDGEGSIRINVEGIEKTIKTRMMIGADGVHSQVRDQAGMPAIPQVPLMQAEIDLPANWDADLTKVWFDITDTPYFYWLIPDKDRKAVVGLISAPRVNIRSLLDKFLEENGFHALAVQSGQVGMYSPDTKVETSLRGLKILMVGEAAGQVKVTTVGGTVTGFAGAKAAALAILENKPYKLTLQKANRELWVHFFIRSLLDKMTNQDYEALIRDLSPNVQMFLSRYDRDQMRRNFWKLPFIQPKYIFLGLKLLFRLVLAKF